MPAWNGVVTWEHGNASGTVRDADGAPVPGALVSASGGGKATADALGGYSFDLAPGTYLLTASTAGYGSETKSVAIVDGQTTTTDFILSRTPANLALGKSASASGYESSSYRPQLAVDGDTGTRWWRRSGSSQWLKVDLGAGQSISEVVVDWYGYYAKSYRVQVSTDNSNWTQVYSTSYGDGGTDTISFEPRTSRYVRVYCTSAASSYNGYSIRELEVYKR